MAPPVPFVYLLISSFCFFLIFNFSSFLLFFIYLTLHFYTLLVYLCSVVPAMLNNYLTFLLCLYLFHFNYIVL